MKNVFRSLVVAAVAALSVLSARAAEEGPKLGLQSWTCRYMTFEEVIAFATKHEIKYLELYSQHLNPRAPKEEILAKKAALDKAGLVCYSFGVANTSLDKEDNRKLFEAAKLLGIKVIAVEPRNPTEWDGLEQLVKEYDIKLAIHNHGKGTVYGDPETVKKILAARDPRIGVCLDIGWVTSAGFDVAKVFREYNGRVYDMHLKDKKVEGTPEKPVVLDVEIGTGQSNLKGLFEEVKKAKWSGVMAIETDNGDFHRDPNKLVASGVAAFKALAK